jgi:hypothetical protein
VDISKVFFCYNTWCSFPEYYDCFCIWYTTLCKNDIITDNNTIYYEIFRKYVGLNCAEIVKLLINNYICHILCSYLTEPFDLTNTARSVYDHDVFERVKAVFQTSYNSLKKTRNIESIFHLHKKD